MRLGDALGLSLPLVWCTTLRVEAARVRVTTTTTTRLRELSTAPAHKDVVRDTAHTCDTETPNQILANERLLRFGQPPHRPSRVRVGQSQHGSVGAINFKPIIGT